MGPSVRKGMLAAVAAVAIALVGGWWWARMQTGGPGEGFVSGNGRIEATEIDIATKYAGRVADIFVGEGDFVKAGQVLAQMQIDVLNAQLDEARALAQQAINAVASAEAQVKMRESDLGSDVHIILDAAPPPCHSGPGVLRGQRGTVHAQDGGNRQ